MLCPVRGEQSCFMETLWKQSKCPQSMTTVTLSTPVESKAVRTVLTTAPAPRRSRRLDHILRQWRLWWHLPLRERHPLRARALIHSPGAAATRQGQSEEAGHGRARRRERLLLSSCSFGLSLEQFWHACIIFC